jgi:hypothetical protein
MVVLKEFEKKQVDWWCQYYQKSLKTLAMRTRQYLNGDIKIGVLEAMLIGVEKDIEVRDKSD